MKALNLVLLAAFLIGTPLMITACEQQSPLEEAAEEVSDEVDDAT